MPVVHWDLLYMHQKIMIKNLLIKNYHLFILAQLEDYEEIKKNIKKYLNKNFDRIF